jgi:ribosomal protein S21
MTEGGENQMAQVQVAVKNGNLDLALRRLKQKLARESVPSECKKRESYMKPGDKRREAKKAGIKNAQKRNRQNRD